MNLNLKDKIIRIMNNGSELDMFLESKNLKFSNLVEITYEDFDENLSSEIFNNAKGLITEPIEVDGLGYFVVKVNSITPKKVSSFDEQRDQIFNFLSEDSVYQVFLENVDLIEEMNLSGSSLKEIADSFPDYSTVSYSEVVSLVGVTGLSDAILQIAGADGTFVV